MGDEKSPVVGRYRKDGYLVREQCAIWLRDWFVGSHSLQLNGWI
jgi:hypothetical protein